MNIDKLKVFRIVEYIKQFPFEYECDDVQENLDSILYDYGIYECFNCDERKLLADELIKLAEKFEISEVVYLTTHSDDPLLAGMKCPEKFSLKAEMIERKMLLAQIKQAHSEVR